jgi:CDP-diacylglycerol---serine O-phosphatidyltransferase
MIRDLNMATPPHRSREQRRRRLRRRRRRAYIRSVYFLPSLATLGNGLCGFAAIYVAGLDWARDPWTRFFLENHYVWSAYFILLAMIFDVLDGRLARFTRHPTDFGGQLDSLADVISFGVAPAYLALEVFKDTNPDVAPIISRLVWTAGALYVACALVRLARFNVSNQQGEQYHFSFLGLPSPGAAGAVASFVLLQQDLAVNSAPAWAQAMTWALPALTAYLGILMVSTIRYPHMLNRYLRGRRSVGRLLAAVVVLLLVVVAFRYTLAAVTLLYSVGWSVSWLWMRLRHQTPRSPSGGPPTPP